MAINKISPSTLTTGVLICDTVHYPGGSSDALQTLTINGGSPVDAALEIKSTSGALLIPRVTTAQRDAMNSVNGMVVYNTETGVFNFLESGDWSSIPPIGAGDVSVVPGGVLVDNIVTFADITGLLIQDSGVSILSVPAPLPRLLKGYKPSAPLVNVNQIGNLGHVQFVNDLGIIFVDALMPVEFITNDFGPGNQACSLFTGGLPSASTTPSALVELQSTTGALLISRMSTSDTSGIFKTPGMMLYNTDTSSYIFYQDTTAGIVIGGNGDSGANFYVGYTAGPSSPSSGSQNSGFGTLSLSSLTSGNSNTAIGYQSLTNVSTDSDNTAVGSSALSNLFSGGSNTAIGANAGGSATTLTSCTFLGNSANAFSDGLTNATAIGANASVGADNVIALGNSAYVGIGGDTGNPAYTLHLGNIFSQCAIGMVNTASTPSTPASGSGLIFVDSEQPFFMDSTGTTFPMANPYNTPEVVWVDAINGNDGRANGSPAKPFLTIQAAALFASGLASATTQYVLKLVGDFTITGTLALYPFVNIDGLGISTINVSSFIYLSSSWSSTSNPTIKVSDVVINALQASIVFSSYQGASMVLDVDWGTTTSIVFVGSGTTAPEKIFMYGDESYGASALIQPQSVNITLDNVPASSIQFLNNSSVYTTTSLIKNCSNIGAISNATSGTKQSYLKISSSPNIGPVTLNTSLSFLTIDSTSYTSVPTFSGSSSISNLTIESLTDGVLQTSYSPVNFTPIGSSNYTSQSLTAMIAGIDAELTASTSDEFYPPTFNSQSAAITMGYSQGGFGGGSVGTVRNMNDNTTSFFNTTSVDSNSKGFVGSVFDGRYLYLVPNTNGQVTRYDTKSSFTSSGSYAVFDTTTVDINSRGFCGGVFDGQYVYFVPNNNGQITRYNTRQPFNSAGSYEVFDTQTVDGNSRGFFGAVFDGNYIYFVPYLNGTSGQITRYNINQSFTSAGSYAVFDTTAVNANSKGFIGAVFDGQYIYFVPSNIAGTPSGQITLYATGLPFTSASSYTVFDTTTVNANSKGFSGAIFDGRYIYFVPSNNGAVFGQVTRYDTHSDFSMAGSYAVFNTTSVDANSKGFFGGLFDGRYVYFLPNNNGATFGQITRYDTTKSFTSSSSYSVYNTTALNASSKGFSGGMYDGKHVYLIPWNNGSSFGQITRIDAYSGPQLPFGTLV